TDFTTFFYDVATDGEVTGFDLSFDVSVAGVVLDENGFVFSNFTNDAGQFVDTFDGYKGLLHHAAAGRYYFLTFDPAAGQATISATSSYAAIPVVPVTAGTPLTGQDVNPISASNPFSFDATAEDWESFRGAADGGTTTGTLATSFYLQTNSFGRL